jgi:hypothetical protein
MNGVKNALLRHFSLRSSSYETCLRVDVTEARVQFGNPEEGERTPLEAANRGLVMIQLTEKNYVWTVANCRLCRSMKCVVTNCTSSIIRLSIQNPSLATHVCENLVPEVVRLEISLDIQTYM